ncbi:MAG: glycosyltransferase [Streptococcaceae bacterium]|jgi:glycosyltransferase involved in cell wall biosynthesis|nr:glycosyltransferase [Streptococcaceae bacterium]
MMNEWKYNLRPWVRKIKKGSISLINFEKSKFGHDLNEIKINKIDAYQFLTNLRPEPTKKTIVRKPEILITKDLSIIVPVYNAEKYLDTCINSVIQQETDVNYELILVDDGSTDRSAEILNSYKGNSHVKVIQKENGGISSARNVGLEICEGKFITFIDNDDLLAEGAIDIMIQTINTSESDIVEFRHQVFISENEIVKNRKSVNPHLIKCKNKSEFVFKANGYVWGKIFSRFIWENIRFPEEYLFEDMITRPLILRQSNSISFSNAVVYSHREIESSFGHNWTKNYGGIEMIWGLINILVENDRLALGRDDILQKIYLQELSYQLYYRTEGYDLELLSNLLTMARFLLEDLDFSITKKFSFWERKVLQAIFDGNVLAWKAASPNIKVQKKGRKI